MSGVDDTFLDPAKAAGGAVQLTHAGEALSSNFNRLAGVIEGLNGQQPWGNDDPGKQFNKQYLEGGDEAPAKVMLDAGKQVVERVSQLGPDVREAIEGTVEMDDLVAKWFGGDK
ncbi:hypothetical protein ACIBSW_35260 [Actinoplanes sp. NPDC049668]|uniref:hypothetical protein n=1 Tax=unclassified Actinoplanes TaxID=2626549 RepID=UPI0033BF3A14